MYISDVSPFSGNENSAFVNVINPVDDDDDDDDDSSGTVNCM